MKINKNSEFDVEFIFPVYLENAISVNTALNEWTKLIKEDKLKKKRELRLKKLNRINNLK